MRKTFHFECVFRLSQTREKKKRNVPPQLPVVSQNSTRSNFNFMVISFGRPSIRSFGALGLLFPIHISFANLHNSQYASPLLYPNSRAALCANIRKTLFVHFISFGLFSIGYIYRVVIVIVANATQRVQGPRHCRSSPIQDTLPYANKILKSKKKRKKKRNNHTQSHTLDKQW